MSITALQLEEEFAKIGPVKAGGVNVKNQKVPCCSELVADVEIICELCTFLKCHIEEQVMSWMIYSSFLMKFLSLCCIEQAGVCYAFVEFEDASSAQSAIEVHILSPFCFSSLLALKLHIIENRLMLCCCAVFACTYRRSLCLY